MLARAPVAIRNPIAWGIDFNLNVMDTTPSGFLEWFPARSGILVGANTCLFLFNNEAPSSIPPANA
jgi:hypothetical protein